MFTSVPRVRAPCIESRNSLALNLSYTRNLLQTLTWCPPWVSTDSTVKLNLPDVDRTFCSSPQGKPMKGKILAQKGAKFRKKGRTGAVQRAQRGYSESSSLKSARTSPALTGISVFPPGPVRPCRTWRRQHF